MSEFSNSFQVRGATHDELAELVTRLDICAAVYPTTSPYTACVIDGDGRFLRSVPNIVLCYQYGEDHGCQISVFQGGEEITSLVHDWGDPDDIELPPGVEVEPTGFNAATWVELGLMTNDVADKVSACLEMRPSYTADYEVPILLGFSNYKWLSVSSLGLKHAPEVFEGATLINVG